MASGGGSNDSNNWLGLLKWSIAHQDGTAPSEARPMSDEDRVWLEGVVKDGIRDDFKIMTGIYQRLCDFLDQAAANPILTTTTTTTTTPTQHEQQQQPRCSSSSASTASPPPPSATTTAAVALATDNPPISPPQPPTGTETVTSSLTVPPLVGAGAGAGALSTFVAPPPRPPPQPSVVATGGVGGGDDGSGGDEAAGEDGNMEGVAEGGGGDGGGLEGIMNDLEELQDICEQIDMAATFAKIGGFGRLIALVAPAHRPEKLRLRAASVIATLVKNNPPAQEAFSSSGGQRSLLRAVSPTPNQGGVGAASSPPHVSFQLHRAILHVLSSSAMGVESEEDALCSDPAFQEFLAKTLAQGGEGSGGGDGAEGGVGGEGGEVEFEGAQLRSKAAFVLKALIGSSAARSGRSGDRARNLWPAVLGLIEGLETTALSGGGSGLDDPGAARETSIEALLAAARSKDGPRIIRELGSRVSSIMARRRQALLGTGPSSRQEEDQESAKFELDLWLQWDSLTEPAQ